MHPQRTLIEAAHQVLFEFDPNRGAPGRAKPIIDPFVSRRDQDIPDEDYESVKRRNVASAEKRVAKGGERKEEIKNLIRRMQTSHRPDQTFSERELDTDPVAKQLTKSKGEPVRVDKRSEREAEHYGEHQAAAFDSTDVRGLNIGTSMRQTAMPGENPIDLTKQDLELTSILDKLPRQATGAEKHKAQVAAQRYMKTKQEES